MLTGVIQDVCALQAETRQQMYNLLARYYTNVTHPQFEHDLAEKEWIALLTDQAGAVQGFSTLMRLRVVVDEQMVLAFFSGDTIINRPYWGETTLPRTLARHAFALAAEEHRASDMPVYWFLISSGYKTYRYLAVFFREFYPTYQHSTPPAIRRIIDTLAELKYGADYDAQRGVVYPPSATPLRSGIADITPHRLKNPHIAFFVAANPGHIHGEELACLTALSPDNLTPAGRRLLAH